MSTQGAGRVIPTGDTAGREMNCQEGENENSVQIDHVNLDQNF